MIILGYISDEVNEEVEEITATSTRVGGIPYYLFQPSEKFKNNLICKNCENNLSLISQSYAPLDDEYNRVIYIFSCVNVECESNNDNSSWKAIVMYKKMIKSRKQLNADKKVKEGKEEVGFDDWGLGDDFNNDNNNNKKVNNNSNNNGFDTNEWGNGFDDDSKDDGDNDDAWGSSFSEEKKEKKKDDAWGTVENDDAWGNNNNNNEEKEKEKEKQKEDDFEEIISEDNYTIGIPGEKHSFSIYPSFYIEVDNEPKHSNGVDKRREEEEESNAKATSMEGLEEEGYEKTPSDLKYLLKYQKRISLSPLQIMRYGFNEEPLLLEKLDDKGVKVRCKYCNAIKVFELQLLGGLCKDLFNKDKDELKNLEFSTCVLFVCPNGCFHNNNKLNDESKEEGWVEETLFIQNIK